MASVPPLRKIARIPTKAIEMARIGRHQIDAHPLASPPEWVRQRYLMEWIDQTGYDTFVETGTHLGATARALATKCRKVFTVELDPGLFREASRRLADLPQVEIISGSSLDALPKILKRLEGPALFWLDARAKPGDTEWAKTHEIPALQEVELILRHQHAVGHVVLINDARFFTGTSGYPSFKQVAKQVAGLSSHEVRVYNDMIHLYSLKK